MTLADDVAAALPEFRAQAESLMQDSCRITATVAGGWDEETGKYLPGATTTIYEGKCRLRNAFPAPQNADAGEAAWAVDIFTLSLPIVGSEAVADGHSVVITASANDPAMVGLEFEVQSGHWQTHSTARRIPVKVVSRDA